jgi:hypothetical protein
MTAVELALWGALLFFALWSGTLAHLKGYNAACWLLAGGLVGVVVLLRLAPTSALEPRKIKRANRLGLLLSALSILAACGLRNFL